MKCIVVEGRTTVSVAYASWLNIQSAEDLGFKFTTHPTVGEARICGTTISKLVVKSYKDWTKFKRGEHIAPNTWAKFR